MPGALGEFRRRQMDEAIEKQSGASPEEARQIAIDNAKANRKDDPTGKGPTWEATFKRLLNIKPDDKEQEKPDPRQLDITLGSSMGSSMLSSEKAAQLYTQASQSKNPAAMLGMLAARTTASVRSQLVGRGVVNDDTVWTSEDGVLDNLLGETLSNYKQYTGKEPTDEDIAFAYDSAIKTLLRYEESEKDSMQQPKQSALGVV